MLETTRTYRATISNHSRVSDALDTCGFAASKLWNVARYHAHQEWNETGKIPSEAALKRELKDHERYSDLHSQSSSFETAQPFRDAKNLRFLSTARSRRTR